MKKQGGKPYHKKFSFSPWFVKEESSISCRVLKKFSDITSYFPKPLKNWITSFSGEFLLIISRFISIFSQFSLNAYIVNGIEKTSKKEIFILYVGDEKLCPYLSELLFVNKPKIDKEFKFRIWNYKKKIKEISSKIDGVFIKSDRFYTRYFEKQGYTTIPEWVTIKVDISEPLEKVYSNCTNGMKEEIKKIKKYGFTYEITEDIDKLRFFYNKMYLPYISWKYGKFGRVYNYYTIKNFFNRGCKILFIKQNDQYLFGGVFLQKDKEVITSYAGVMQGKYDRIKQGLITASYYYLIQHSKEIGANLVDFGSCRPFVKDGLYNYKRKWGALIGKSGNECAQIYSIKFLSDKNEVNTFFENNPLVPFKN